MATCTPHQTYFEGAQFVHFLLGPATVAIAVPLVRHLTLVRANIVPMMVGLFAGAVTAVVSVVAVAAAFGVPREILVSLAPKSVTARIAMAYRRAWAAAGADGRTCDRNRRHGRVIVTPR